MPRPGIKLTAAELHLLEGPFRDSLQTEPHGHGNFKGAITDDCHLGRLLSGLEDALGGDLAGVGPRHVDMQVLQHYCSLVGPRNLDKMKDSNNFL